MSSIISPQGVVLATAMAVSGTVVLLAIRLQKSDQIPQSSSQPILRSCISTAEGKKKTKKRVHFAKDVVDPTGDGEEFRRQHGLIRNSSSSSSSSSSQSQPQKMKKSGGESRGMPANRMALYNGILRDRVVHRLAYSY